MSEQQYEFRYTLRNGDTGTGVISAPSADAVGMLARARFQLHEDVRIYEVEEVKEDESKDTISRTAKSDSDETTQE